MANRLLVLDSIESLRTLKLCGEFSLVRKNCDVIVVEYENALISFFQRTKYCGKFFARILYWIKSFSAAFNIFFSKNRWPKGVIFVNPIVGIFYCFLCSLLLCRNKYNIVVSGFLFENKSSSLYLFIRSLFVKFSYRCATKIVVYGSSEISHYAKLFPELTDKFVFIPYGRNFSNGTEKYQNNNTVYISSGGASNRDYSTLLNAIKYINNDLHIKNFPIVKIATRPSVLDRSDIRGVEVIYDISPTLFGDFLSKSVFFVLPLADVQISAGHMALLEAMSLGKKIIVSDIQAVRDYVTDGEVFLYRSGDYVGLAEAMLRFWFEPDCGVISDYSVKSKCIYDLKYTQLGFLNRLLTLV